MIINGIDEKEFRRGWWGRNKEGQSLLRELGLPDNRLPFDINRYLVYGKANVKVNGKNWQLEYHKSDNLFEFSLLRFEKPKVTRLYREWGGEDLNMVLELESYAVGEYTRYALSGKLPRIENI